MDSPSPMGSVASAADGPALVELRVKAAFLSKFALYIDWPDARKAGSDKTIVVGLLGGDPFGLELDKALKDQRIGARGFLVRRIASVDEVGECQILFVASKSAEWTREVIKRLGGRATLTVGDSEEFARCGGMIGFIREDGKVRFAINLAASKRAGLTISSKLLRVSKLVTEGATEAP